MASSGSGRMRGRGARGRPREGTGRMDAAVDAMKQMGFERDIITQTVKGLLQVYGRDGWMFIEEHSYSVLLDTLLERQSDSDQEIAEQERGHDGETSAAGESSVIHSPPSSSRQAVDATLRLQNISLQQSSKGHDVETLAAGKSRVIHSPPSSGRQAVDGRLQSQNFSLQQSSKGNEAETSAAGKSSMIRLAPCSTMHDIDAALEAKQILSPSLPQNESLESAPHNNEPDAKPEGRGETPRKRKPCYGWISDGDDDEEFVELAPAYPVAKRKSF